jgi:fengycin family lipopeptide synthetase D
LKIQDFFKYRTVEALATYIEETSNVLVAEKKESYTKKESKEKGQVNVDDFQVDTVNHPKAVLLTGATGYLGAHVLERLLNVPSTVIYCLVRNNRNEALDAKLKERMVFYFGKDILQKISGRVKCVEGDLSLDNLGFDIQIMNELEEKIDSIIHCGGDVRHYGEREHFQKVNVQSTNYLLRLAEKVNARFHYVSTLSVAGHAENDPNEFEFFESDFDRGQMLDNVYLESKFQAEKMVREAIEKGIRATIYRVGNLVGHSTTGEFQYNINENAFYRLLKGMIVSKAAPNIHTYIDLTPVDYGSLAITELSYRENTVGQTMHICNPIQLNWSPFIQSLQSFGYDISLMNENEYMNKFFSSNLALEDQQALELILPLLESAEEKSLAISSCEYTGRYLKKMNVHCAKPTQEYIHLLLQHAVERNFFPPVKQSIMA